VNTTIKSLMIAYHVMLIVMAALVLPTLTVLLVRSRINKLVMFVDFLNALWMPTCRMGLPTVSHANLLVLNVLIVQHNALHVQMDLHLMRTISVSYALISLGMIIPGFQCLLYQVQVRAQKFAEME
jgi:hypothetical protein